MKVMVVGSGAMGKNHVRVLSGLTEVSEVLVVDSRQEVLSEVSKIDLKVKTFSSIEDALKEKPEACTIATPTPTHYEIFRKVNGRVKGILVEKPIAETLEDGAKIVNEAKKTGTVLQIGHIERFNSGVLALKKNASQIGQLRYASTHRFGVPSRKIADDVIIDLAVHDIDVLCFISGETPSSVICMERKGLEKDCNDIASIVLEFPSFQATVEANRVTTVKTRELMIVGEKGNAILNYINQDLILTYSENPNISYSTFDEVVMRVGRGTEIKPHFQREEPLKLELSSFLKAVKTGETPLVTGEDGLTALRIAISAIESAKTGKQVKL